MMIALKFILAVMLAILPFLCSKYFRHVPTENKDGEQPSTNRRTLINFLSKYLPRLKNLLHTVENFFLRLSRNMHRSDNARKFFVLMLLIILLCYTFVDFQATNAAREIIRLSANGDGNITTTCIIYGTTVSNSYTMLLCQLSTFMLFSYKFADKILNWLRNNWNYMAMADLFLIAAVAVFAQRHFILVEVLTIYLLAASVYPPKANTTDPKGRKPIPLKQQSEMFRKAA